MASKCLALVINVVNYLTPISTYIKDYLRRCLIPIIRIALFYSHTLIKFLNVNKITLECVNITMK